MREGGQRSQRDIRNRGREKVKRMSGRRDEDQLKRDKKEEGIINTSDTVCVS